VVFHVIPNPWHINAGIQGLITNMLALVIVSLLTKPMDLQHVRRFTDV